MMAIGQLSDPKLMSSKSKKINKGQSMPGKKITKIKKQELKSQKTKIVIFIIYTDKF
jgi:hypothetical protein